MAAACAFPNWRACRWRRCGQRRISSASPARAARSGWRRLSPAARTAMDAYLDVRDEFVPKTRQEQPLSFRFAGRGWYLTRRRFHQLLKALALKAGIDPAKVSPACAAPCLRHPSGGRRRGLAQRADACSAMPTSPPPKSTPMSRRDHLNRVMAARPSPGKSRKSRRKARLTHWNVSIGSLGIFFAQAVCGIFRPSHSDQSHALSGIRTSHRRAGRQDRRAAESSPRTIPTWISTAKSRSCRPAPAQLVRDTYARLTPWQKVQVARHPGRPHFLDYAKRIFDDFTPLAGDRAFGEDQAVVAGLARFRGRAVAFIGQEKGNDTQEPHQAQFRHGDAGRLSQGGAPVRTGRPLRPAGAVLLRYVGRLSRRHAPKSAARPKPSRARSKPGFRCKAPFIATIIGEGMSGGAIAIAAANRVYMLEHSIYSVISPEGCASILWRSADKAQEAATALKITAQDLLELKLIDAIVPEPVGGAHRAPREAIDAVGRSDREGA